MRRTLILLTSLLLAGCVNESASYYVDGKEHSLTLRVEQDYFWQEDVTLKLVAARLPDCQRLFTLGQEPPADLAVEVFTRGDNTYTIRAGKQVWMIETNNCTQLPDTSKPAFGEPVGVFKIANDKLVFEAAAPAAGTAAAAAVTPAADAAPAAAAAPTPSDVAAPAATGAAPAAPAAAN
jgi:hypothetical protein